MNSTSNVSRARFGLTADGGSVVEVHSWRPRSTPRLVVILLHGISEHAVRYDRVAQRLASEGIAVVAPDHRGHGATGKNRLGHVGPDGWNGMLSDVRALFEKVRSDDPGVPIVLFGHSMGSLLAQGSFSAWGRDLAGLVLSGTFGVLPNLDTLIEAVSGEPPDEPSAIFSETFGSLNAAWPHGATGFEWLSRDPGEVQKYVNDPACGFVPDARFIADMLRGARETWRPENEGRALRGTPVLFLFGDEDPAGGNGTAVDALIDRYRALGMSDLTIRRYPGARHEILNETNRDEVERDLVAWLVARA